MVRSGAEGAQERGSVRLGTATRRGGQQTAARIVEAGLEVLAGDGNVQFSMRAVAEHAGVSLANLQYYFPSREDLLQALFVEIGRRYAAAYDESMARAPDSPRQRFEVAIRWNLHDIAQKSTRQLFVRLWELLGSLDDFSGRWWGQLYELDISQLAGLIAAMHPEVSGGEIRCRATLLAAMIEGLMVVQGEPGRGARRLAARALQQAFAIADGLPAK